MNTIAAESVTVNAAIWVWVVSLLIGVLFAWICARIAGGKGYSRVLFAILGFFFTLITLIVALVLPRRSTGP